MGSAPSWARYIRHMVNYSLSNAQKNVNNKPGDTHDVVFPTGMFMESAVEMY